MNRVSSFVSACIVSGITLIGSAEAQTTWFVDASAVPPGNGTPASPYVLIQDALDAPATLDGDTIQVAPSLEAEWSSVTSAIRYRQRRSTSSGT
jgi:hypothetical protein